MGEFGFLYRLDEQFFVQYSFQAKFYHLNLCNSWKNGFFREMALEYFQVAWEIKLSGDTVSQAAGDENF